MSHAGFLLLLLPAWSDGSVLPPSTATAAEPAAFQGSVEPLSVEVRAEMVGVSWRPGCPVGLDGLRLVRVRYHTLDGTVADGEIVAATDVADDLLRVFEALWTAGFPLARVRRIEAYGGDDDRSMADDNTSAFNCRPVNGGRGWSQHAFGTAIDLNPLENPMVRGTEVSPPAGAAYLDRSDVRPGMITAGDAVVTAFTGVSWGWGGSWRSLKDYQHFSRSGR